MFEKEADEYADNTRIKDKNTYVSFPNERISELQDFEGNYIDISERIIKTFKEGAEFGYNKAKEDARLKLKDKGIIQPLKSSILRNERLSSQEQQELCAWIECAMDFGENLDECAKELEEANKANEWHYPSKGELPKCDDKTQLIFYVNCYYEIGGKTITRKRTVLGYYQNSFLNDDIKLFVEKSKGYEDEYLPKDVIAWKEIVLPKEIKEK